jgi:hypothetical protein
MKPMNKKGAVVTDLVSGTGKLILTVVIIGVFVSTILGANLLTSGGVWDNATSAMEGNFTSGIDNVNTKIPTILLVAGVVLLFGVLAVLVAQAGRMGFGGGSL